MNRLQIALFSILANKQAKGNDNNIATAKEWAKKVAYNCLDIARDKICKAYIFILVLQEINNVLLEKCTLVTFHSSEGRQAFFF